MLYNDVIDTFGSGAGCCSGDSDGLGCTGSIPAIYQVNEDY
jgi:hypothetical protein